MKGKFHQCLVCYIKPLGHLKPRPPIPHQTRGKISRPQPGLHHLVPREPPSSVVRGDSLATSDLTINKLSLEWASHQNLQNAMFRKHGSHKSKKITGTSRHLLTIQVIAGSIAQKHSPSPPGTLTTPTFVPIKNPLICSGSQSEQWGGGGDFRCSTGWRPGCP